MDRIKAIPHPQHAFGHAWFIRVPQDWLPSSRIRGRNTETYGVPVEQVVEGIKHGVGGVCLIALASTGSIRRFLAEHPAEFDLRKYLAASLEAMKAVVSTGTRHSGRREMLQNYPAMLSEMQAKYAA